MDLGIVWFSGSSVSPARLAHAVEERGFESLFYPEHTHVPVSSTRADGRSTRGYANTYDPFVALSAGAAVTTTLRIGTAVCLVTQRDPIVTAKEVASLDLLSGGRFLFGVGAGWNRDELRNHGTDPARRMAVLAERVHAMKTIWAQDDAAFHGTHVDFDPIWSWPKPAEGHVPVLVGGNGPSAEDRVLDFGDGWMPQCAHLSDVAELGTRVAALRARADERGRPYVPVTLFAVPDDRALLEQVAAVGVDRCLLALRDADETATLHRLDELAALLGRAAA